jgi:D-3-phosphoglycerate dehydrogenase
MIKILQKGRAIVMGLEKINLKDFPKLEVIGCNCTGLDHLPWDEIKKRNIKVISLKDYPKFTKTITSTAEHTIGLIIALLRNYKTALNFPYNDREYYKGHTLQDKKIGLIGYGRVAQQVTERLSAFSKWDIHFYETGLLRHYEGFISEDDRQVKGRMLKQVLERSDIISIHIPLQNNEGFFTKKMFRQMKKTAFFVNTSRSKIVEDGALLWALENKIIAGATVDFID